MMKKLFLTLAFVLFATVVSAQELLLGSDGSVRVTTAPVEYVKTGVTVAPEAAKYTAAIIQAYEKPGVPITVTWSVTPKKHSIFGVTYVSRGDQAILFNQEENLISLVDSSELKEQKGADTFLVTLLISAMFMLLSWVMNRLVKDTLASTFAAFAAAAFAAYVAIFGSAFVLTAAIIAFVAGFNSLTAYFTDEVLPHRRIGNWDYIMFYLFLSISIATYIVGVL